jgi:hypothetical protein
VAGRAGAPAVQATPCGLRGAQASARGSPTSALGPGRAGEPSTADTLNSERFVDTAPAAAVHATLLDEGRYLDESVVMRTKVRSRPVSPGDSNGSDSTYSFMIVLPGGHRGPVHEETMMDLLNSEVPDHLSLDRLCAGALCELEKLGYSRGTLRRYRLVWEHLSTFSCQLNLGNEYSRELAMRFEDTYGLHEGECIKRTDAWRRCLLFGVKVLDDYARMGGIVRFATEMQKLQVAPAMQKPLREYEHYGRDRRHLRPSTLRERMREIAVFLDFLGSRNVTTLDQMQADDISAFVTSRQRMKSKTMSRIVSDVRSFLQFLFVRDILPRDFSAILPTIRVTRNATIPSVWDPGLVVKLLEVVDRSSPKGRRD